MATVSNPIPLRTELESPSTTPPPLAELATPTPAGLAPPPVSTFCARISVFSKLAAAAADSPPVVAPEEEEGETPVVCSCAGAKLAEARDGGKVTEFCAALGTGLGEAVVLVPAREASVCTREPRTGAEDGREMAAGVGVLVDPDGVPGVVVSKDCGCIGCVCEGGVS